MLGFALLGMLGLGLIFNIGSGDDDDDTSDERGTREQGTEDNETFDLGDGDDTVFAAGGNDLVSAGQGDDRVFGGDGNDFLVGGEDKDFIRGGADDDALFGGAGNDVLNGDVGDDALFGADIIDSEAWAEFLIPRDGDAEDEDFEDLDLLDPDGDPMEADTLNGGVGDDLLVAGSNDVVDTGTGSDTVNVGDWVDPSAPVNMIDFDPAKDAIVYSFSGSADPTVLFGEDDSGTATLTVNGQIIALFPGVDFFDLVDETSVFLERLDAG